MNKDKLIIRSFFAAVILVIIVSLFACNAERQVLADIEKVKRVRAVTDALFPCVTKDSLVFIHDSTTVETIKRDTLIEELNDTTYYFITDTVTKVRTVTKERWRVDDREVNKLTDSLTAIRLREASFKGQILQLQSTSDKYLKQRNTYVAILVGLILAALVFVIYKFKPKFI